MEIRYKLFIGRELTLLENFGADLQLFLVQSPLSSLNLIDDRSLRVEEACAISSINSINGLHQEPNQLVHLILFFDYQINCSRLEAKTQALPCEERVRLPLAFLLTVKFQSIVVHRNQVLPIDPESRRCSSEKNGLDVLDTTR